MKIERITSKGGCVNLSLPTDLKTEAVRNSLGVRNNRLALKKDRWEAFLLREVFLQNGSFVVPTGITLLTIATAGAGGGSPRHNSSSAAAYRRGAGGGISLIELEVEPGQTVSVTVGKGGTRNSSNQYIASSGGSSYISYKGEQYAIAQGGERGTNQYRIPPPIPNGGSGNIMNGQNPPSPTVPGQGAEITLPDIGYIKAGSATSDTGEDGMVVIGY